MEPATRPGSPLDYPLAAADQQFFDNDFQLYRPGKGCHSNFGELKGCKVFFIADRYQSGTLAKSQEEFFKRFGQKGDCLLLENYAPHEPVPSRDILRRWPSFPPEIEVRGSDIRALTKDREKLQATQKAMQEKWQPQMDIMGKHCTLMRITAFLINEALQNGNAVIHNAKLRVQPEITTLIDKICKMKNQLLDQYNALQLQVQTTSDGVSYSIKASNRGLTDCIAEMAQDQKIQKIFVLWGMHNFFEMREIYERMGEQKISYCVLFPSTQKLCQVEEELGRAPRFLLAVYPLNPVGEDGLLIRMQRSCLPAFASALLPLFTSTEVWMTPELLQTCKNVALLPSESLLLSEVVLNDERIDQYFNDPLLPLILLKHKLRSLALTSHRQITFNGGPMSVGITFEPNTCKYYLSCLAVEAINVIIKPVGTITEV